jgi:Mu-like prophage protein
MRTLTKTILLAVLALMLTSATAVSISAQYNTSESAVRDIVRSIQTRTDNLRRTLQNSTNRGNVSSSQLYELNRLIDDFSTATTQLDRRFGSRRTSTSDVRLVLDRAALVDNYFANYRIGFAAQRDWQALRSDLDRLALAYNINSQWGSGSSSNTGPLPNDFQLRQLVQRIDTRTSNFSRQLRLDLNRRGGYNDRYSADQVRSQLSQFESAVMQFRNRANSRQATASDARNVLQQATFLQNFVADTQLSNLTKNNWNLLRQDLDQLATTFNVSWNWSNPDAGYPGNYPDSGYGNGRLTGTYRINNSRSEDVRRAAELATRNLPVTERQRVYDSLLRRLDPPDMLAIDQRGNNVTISSTRAQQIQFVANGGEQVETTNGRTVRVRSTLTGNTLRIERSGERANDFSVTFESVDNGRQLLVTRQLYSDRFTQPVVVRSYYDKSSDVAQLNLYETNPEYGTGGVTATGDFVVPNGTELIGVLNQDLSTRNVQENDRFTMTVRSPGQFDGATIEGYVTGVDRAGRITGRSQATLNFDTIRLRNGQTSRFAGILSNVRTPNGDVVRVDTEGAVRDDDNQTNRTVTRTAIGTAVGALIGAIAGGGKGAAIGAVIGAGAGAGSVYVQGRTDLELPAGTEITVQATGPRN